MQIALEFRFVKQFGLIDLRALQLDSGSICTELFAQILLSLPEGNSLLGDCTADSSRISSDWELTSKRIITTNKAFYP